jgi:hypothetical protein
VEILGLYLKIMSTEVAGFQSSKWPYTKTLHKERKVVAADERGNVVHCHVVIGREAEILFSHLQHSS